MNPHNAIWAEQKDSISPICPHCDEEIHTIYYRVTTGFFGKRYLYFCSSCSVVLGMSQRKGFWMG